MRKFWQMTEFVNFSNMHRYSETTEGQPADSPKFSTPFG